MRVFGAMLLTAAVLLTGCTSPASGNAAAGAYTAKSVFGDFTTYDPCSLVDLDVFADVGRAKVGQPASFEYCTVDINPGDDKVMVGALAEVPNRDDFENVRNLPGGMWTGVYADEDAGYCDTPLVFADGIGLTLNAWSEGDEPPGNLCEVADAAMTGVLAVVRSRGVEHHRYPADSLAAIDPCEVVAADVLAAVPGYAAVTDQQGFPAGHVCTWSGDDPDGPHAQLTFGLGVRQEADAVGAQDVAGRPSVVSSKPDIGGRSWCQVDTDHIAYSGGQKDTVEKATLDAYGPVGTIDQTCAAALAVAAAAWPDLPKP